MRPLLVCQLHALLVCDVDPLLEDGAHDAIEGAQVAESRLDHRQELVLILLCGNRESRSNDPSP